MNYKLYEETVRRLARMGAKDPTSQIIALAEEIERYRDRIRELEAQPPSGPKGPPVQLPRTETPLTAEDLTLPRAAARWVWGRVCGQDGYYCTNCQAGWTWSPNAELIAASHDYCPKCGARMDPYPPK